jgi:predicted MPP superfamily phosphohydrolase
MFFHPFEGDLTQLKDQEVENKLFELNKKYYAAARLGNHDLLTQLSTFITIYRDELSRRYAIKTQQNDSDLDQLINVD